ncbi:hypothetical protein [Holophaga foetida]|uniref:hypothetical protein n=1 Tax=Holophaga foetida TaxID=35839 RepID=UPI00130E4DA9|nr:hypothetical protein [Holophaga foetida]
MRKSLAEGRGERLGTQIRIPTMSMPKPPRAVEGSTALGGLGMSSVSTRGL